MSIPETKRAEISAIVKDIRETSKHFARLGVDVSDPFESGEAIQIIKRIERRILENMQATDHPTHEAAE